MPFIATRNNHQPFSSVGIIHLRTSQPEYEECGVHVSEPIHMLIATEPHLTKLPQLAVAPTLLVTETPSIARSRLAIMYAQCRLVLVRCGQALVPVVCQCNDDSRASITPRKLSLRIPLQHLLSFFHMTRLSTLCNPKNTGQFVTLDKKHPVSPITLSPHATFLEAPSVAANQLVSLSPSPTLPAVRFT